MITSTAQIRTSFLDYFAEKNHQVMPSSALVPGNDPTLMFVNAGMVQFKEVFTGRRPRPTPCAATVQKCIRISGKHNDLENVGRTSRHHTFFEMLGNFSFGDYFKKEACLFGYEFLTKRLGLDPAKLWISVFEGDDRAPRDTEAERIWLDEVGVPKDRLLFGSAKDNFWSMGDTGPCGPCSEILYDRGEAFGEATMENGERFFEIWNLVFMQYNVEEAGGPLNPLPAPSIDTGAGLERIASILQGVDTNYDIDLFKPLVALSAQLAGKTYNQNESDDISMRVLADHARMAAFLVAEGIFPEKTGREYVLRRVMRRAIRHAHRLGIEDLFLHKLADKVVDLMGDAYPELVERRELISRVCKQEEERFRETLGRGLELLAETKNFVTTDGDRRLLPGKVAFDLSSTYGFPRDLIEVIGEEEGFFIDEEGYAKAEEEHKIASGAGKIGDAAVADIHHELAGSLEESTFLGYDQTQTESQIIAIIHNNKAVAEVRGGSNVEIVLDRTPFYAEAGGQIGDMGTINREGGELQVADTIVPVQGLRVHVGQVLSGRLRVGDRVRATIDTDRRDAIRRHHTATHLLHAALHNVLGTHAVQKGSRVGPDTLRFDFAHFEPPTIDELRRVEQLVNNEILANHPVETAVMSYDEARSGGAMALFEENYGDVVRQVTAAPTSRELCGGTHVQATGEIGSFYITAETGIAAGVRRIEAVVGRSACAWVTEQRGTLESTATLLKTQVDRLVEKAEKVLTSEKELRREVESLKKKLAGGGRDLASDVREIEGVKVLGVKLDVGDPGTMRETADTLRGKLGSGIVCLGGENKGKALVLVAVTDDLTGRFQAGSLVREIAGIVGGKGGGRPDMAQAGGPDIDKLDEAVAAIYSVVSQLAKQ